MSLSNNNKFTPEPLKLNIYVDYANELHNEYEQCIDEGLKIEQYKDLLFTVKNMPSGEFKEKFADIISEMIPNLPRKADFPYNEPSTLDEIRALCNTSLWESKKAVSDKEKKIAGAWYGRIAGCLLGKPIEGIRDELIPFLKDTGNYPMHRYITDADLTDDIVNKYEYGFKGKCYPDTIECAPVDDDTNYPVLYQNLIEKYGRDFTANDVASFWLVAQPVTAYYTAERAAYINTMLGYLPPHSAIVRNPYREWIGAQIRGDYFGYINMGNPEKAAEMAFRDASVSHIKNGIYGEMWASAMIACAAVCDTAKEAVLGGLSQIPQTSRLYKEVFGIIEKHENGKTFDELYAFVHKKYDHHNSHHWCHTISNALIVTTALLCGEDDFSKSICLAAQCGFDTDCNAATVGSVIGMMKGIDAIDECWTKPLNGRLRTQVFGSECVEIQDLINKTIEQCNQ